MLAQTFPGGSARNEIKRRVLARAVAGETRGAAAGIVIEELVGELVDLSQKLRDRAAGVDV